MSSRWVSEQEVARLREQLIGKFCDNRCQGAGAFVEYRDGMAHIIDCSCAKEFIRIIRLMDAGISRRYWDFSIDDLTPTFVEENAVAVAIVRRYINNISTAIGEGVGIYFCGGKGVAKTALSCLILRAALDAGLKGCMLPVSQLTALIRDAIDSREKKERLEWIRDEAQIIFIDEIDKDFISGDTSSFTGTYVNDFFRHTYDRMATLIVTSNIDRNRLVGKQASNVVDRLNELIEIPLVGTSFRTSTKAEKVILHGS